MIWRILGIFVILLIAGVIAYFIHEDYKVRKNTNWVIVEAEVMETKLESQTKTSETHTKWFDTADYNRQQDVNVIVERPGPVDITVEPFAVATTSGTHTQEFKVRALYKYTYEGNEYTVWEDVSGFLPGVQADNKALQYPKGRKLQVYIQTANPQVSQIPKPDKSFPTISYVVLSLMTIMFILIVIFAQAGEPPRRRGTTIRIR